MTFICHASRVLIAALSIGQLSIGQAWALDPGTTGQAVRIIDGDTLDLADGTVVRLVGLQAPKPPLGRAGPTLGSLADESRRVLGELALGKTLSLSFGGRRRDRYGRVLAHLHDQDGTWIQAEMLRRGMALVHSLPDNRARVREMLALEHKARLAAVGIWSSPLYSIRTVDESRGFVGTFQLVEGRVLSVAEVRRRTYLNFGEDWKTDFTVTVAPRDLRRFTKSGVDLQRMEGHVIRVRGWLKLYNGPMIEATHPEQIEMVPE